MLVATGALDLGRYSVAAGCVGILEACLDASVAHTGKRHQGGGLLRDHQLVRAKITDMLTHLNAARLLRVHAGQLKDARDPETLAATWMAKYFASTSAMRAASDAVQLHGASGCADGHPVNRYFRDAKIMEIIEGSTEIQQITIAEQAFRYGERA
jgi:alkylation response protein AidB-like acyl-CoA dehydrogenase